MKKLTKVLCGIFCVIAVAGIGTTICFGVANNNLQYNFVEQIKSDVLTYSDNSAAVINESVNSGINLSCAKILSVENAEEDRSFNMESAFSISAVISSEAVVDKTILWSLQWKNSESTWASDKNICDYVTINTINTHSGESVTISCVQDFGEQIILTARSAEFPSYYAESTIDYVKKIKSIDYIFKYDNEIIETPECENGIYRVDYTDEEKFYTVELSPIYSEYTIDDAFNERLDCNFSAIFNENFWGTKYPKDNLSQMIKLQAGLSDRDILTYPINSYNAFMFKTAVDSLVENTTTDIPRTCVVAENFYAALTADEKANDYVKWYKDVYDFFCNNYFNFDYTVYATYDEFLLACKEKLDSYDGKTNYGDYYNSGHFFSIENLVTASLLCNSADVGILECVINYTGNYTTSSFNLSLGFTTSSLQRFNGV